MSRHLRLTLAALALTALALLTGFHHQPASLADTLSGNLQVDPKP